MPGKKPWERTPDEALAAMRSASTTIEDPETRAFVGHLATRLSDLLSGAEARSPVRDCPSPKMRYYGMLEERAGDPILEDHAVLDACLICAGWGYVWRRGGRPACPCCEPGGVNDG